MTTKEEKTLSRSYDNYFRKKLLDPAFCKEYLNSALEEAEENECSDQEFVATLINCIRDVVYAHGGVDKFIEKTNIDLHRTTFYKFFSYSDNLKNGPEFITVLKVIKACGASIKVA